MGFLQASGHKIFINQSVPSLVLFVSGIYIYICFICVSGVCVCVCIWPCPQNMEVLRARDRMLTTAVTQATEVTVPDPLLLGYQGAPYACFCLKTPSTACSVDSLTQNSWLAAL